MLLNVQPIQPLRNQKSETKRSGSEPQTMGYSFAGMIQKMSNESEAENGKKRQDGYAHRQYREETPQAGPEKLVVIRPPIETLDRHSLMMLYSQRV